MPPVGLWELFLRTGGSSWSLSLVVLLIASAANFYYSAAANQFARYGVETTAVVERKWVEIDSSSDSTKRIYWVRLRYQVGIVDHVVKAKVPKTHYNSIALSDVVPLRYLNHAPHRFEYPENYYRDWLLYSHLLSAVIGIGWLLTTWSAGKWTVNAISARRMGTHRITTIAAVHRVKEKEDDEKDSQKALHKLLWREPNGKFGESLPAPLSEFHGYAKGDEIIVFHYKGKSYWRGDVGDRIPRFNPIPQVKRR